MNPEWLPDLVLFSDSGGEWTTYLENVYQVFYRDFVAGRPSFQGRDLALKRYPLSRGKEATFWHLVSSGPVEDDRLPDLRRLERIGWPRAIIEHWSDPEVLSWENKRQGERRVCLWLESALYLVVLAKRSRYTLLWTAYPVTREHQQRKLRREYERFHKG